MRSRQEHGFSLLEIMVVVVIIGILVSVFTLSVGSFADAENAEHARRLEALVTLASEEAAMQAREIGLRFYQQGYEFSARVLITDEKSRLQLWQWVPLDDDRLLKPRILPDDYSIELVIDGKEVELVSQRAKLSAKQPYEPQIVLFSTGEVTPAFTASIRQSFNDELVAVSVGTDGKTEIKTDAF